jgi:HD-like signal output (HDOD) protein
MIATPISSEALLQTARKLHPGLQLLGELGRTLSNFRASDRAVVELLRPDSVFATEVTHLANRLFQKDSPSASLEETVATFGLTEVYRLVGFATVMRTYDRHLLAYDLSASQVRENSLFTALLAEALVDTGRVDPRAAFTAGLLRSLGKTALDYLADDSHRDVRMRPAATADWEMAYLGMTNCDAAALILRAWRFPSDIVAGIRDHYLIGARPPAGLAVTLNIAAGVAARCGFDLPGEGEYLELTAEKLAAAGLTEAAVNDAMVRTLYAFNHLRLALA